MTLGELTEQMLKDIKDEQTLLDKYADMINDLRVLNGKLRLLLHDNGIENLML